MSCRMRPLIQLIFGQCHTFAECFHEIFREHIQLGRVSFGALHGMPSKPFPCKKKKIKNGKKLRKLWAAQSADMVTKLHCHDLLKE